MRHLLGALFVFWVTLSGCAEGCEQQPVDDAGVLEQDAGADDAPSIIDPLSRPAEPTLSVSAFIPAADCGTCHEQHYEEWQTSMHAYAMVDPVFQKLVLQRQLDRDGQEDTFCVQCHSSIGTRSGEIKPGFSFDSLSPIVMEGVTCQACHLISHLERPYNSGHFIDQFGPIRGPIEDPTETAFHASSYSPVFEESIFCAGCHDVVEMNGLNLERPYEEWLESPGAAEGKTCQSCHMPEYTGQADVSAPERVLHRHRFVGAEVPLLDGFVTEEQKVEIRQDVANLLRDAVSLTVQAPEEVGAGEQIDLVLLLQNQIDSHSFPTGSTFIRQSWIEVTAKDMTGRQLYATGTLDANGDLKNHFSSLEPYADPDLISLSSSLFREDGEPEMFPWRATEHHTNAIPPLYDRTYSLFIPTTEALEWPVTIEVRVLFRSLPPYLLRELGEESYVADLDIFEVATASALVELAQ